MPQDPRRPWRDKLDEHEKAVNALLMALAGGLLAFSADYVKVSAGHLVRADRVLAALAVAGASLSLSLGALRSFLRSKFYASEIGRLDMEEASALYMEATKREPGLIADAEKQVRELLRNSALSEDTRSTAIQELYDKALSPRFDAMRLQFATIIPLAPQVRLVRIMERLTPFQILTFLVGALAVAVMVFRQLAA